MADLSLISPALQYYKKTCPAALCPHNMRLANVIKEEIKKHLIVLHFLLTSSPSR